MVTTPASYWPFWLTGLVLGSMPIAFWIVLRCPLGVSGILSRFTNLREELREEREGAAAPEPTAEELEQAMLAATMAMFGEEAMTAPPSSEPEPEAAAGRSMGPKPSLAAHAAFLVAVVAGGLASRLLHGGWRPMAGLGPGFASLFGTGPGSIAVLLGGGFLVGMGTSICGGCSSGHGLFGCSRLQPGSLLATGSFMAAAIATSLALGRALS